MELIILKNKRSTTTSLIVAETFGKRHDRVIRKIEELIETTGSSRLFFGEAKYIDEQGKSRKMYEMDRKAFTILVMGFTGKKALEWKMRFYDAFEAMELAIVRQQNLDWTKARIEGKQVRRELTDEIKEFVEYATHQGSKSPSLYYMNISKMTNHALFLIERKAPQDFRNLLDGMQISFLQTAEYVARNALREGVKGGMFYKDIYKFARDKVKAFASTVGKTPVLENTLFRQIAI
jgi:Rha family phage regulatory protein